MSESNGEEIFTTWVSELDEGNVAAVYLCGELDASTAPALLSDVQGLAETGRDVIVDVHLLSYIDSTGVSALLSIKSALARAGRRLALVGCHGILARILEVSQVQSEFPCYRDVETALAEMRSGGR